MKPLVIISLAALAAHAALAADEPRLRRADPYVPPAARVPGDEPPSSGAALQAQVDDKLRRRFDAADGGRFGSITRHQAERAGFGFVAQHFDRIDRRASGSVTFEELRRYLAERARTQ